MLVVLHCSTKTDVIDMLHTTSEDAPEQFVSQSLSGYNTLLHCKGTSGKTIPTSCLKDHLLHHVTIYEYKIIHRYIPLPAPVDCEPPNLQQSNIEKKKGLLLPIKSHF